MVWLGIQVRAKLPCSTESPTFFDVTGGNILFDSVDIWSLTEESVRRHIVMVPHEAMLFNASANENIAPDRPKEIVTEEAIREAAQKANADIFIEQLPKGYETVLNKQNLYFSRYA